MSHQNKNQSCDLSLTWIIIFKMYELLTRNFFWIHLQEGRMWMYMGNPMKNETIEKKKPYFTVTVQILSNEYHLCTYKMIAMRFITFNLSSIFLFKPFFHQNIYIKRAQYNFNKSLNVVSYIRINRSLLNNSFIIWRIFRFITIS